MKKLACISIFTIVAISLAMAGCQPANDTSTPEATPIAEPQEGFATVIGMIKPLSNIDLEGIIVRLAKVHRFESGEGIFTLESANSPFTATEENGVFIFSDIEPGEYVLVFGDPMTKYQIISSDEETAKIWQVFPNEINDFGIINIDF